MRGPWAFGCFCILLSGIYCLNDVFNASTDRLRPRKRQRPVASGSISASAALALAAAGIGAALVGSAALAGRFPLICGLYVVNNKIYFTFLKQRVIVGVYTVSPQTIDLHRTENLIYTVPLVAYGIFR
jgi:decaprenyl-phosphate phosphoribosyltransferase